jgi:hypothetical protein
MVQLRINSDAMVQLSINSDANDFLKFFQNEPFPRQTFELGKFIITAAKNIKHLVTFVMFGFKIS